MINIKHINKIEVKKIKNENLDTRPIKGKDICNTCYSNMFLVAPTCSGKTTVIFEMLKRCAGKKTKIIAFVSTIYNDQNWNSIRIYFKKKKISFTSYTSIFENQDLLQTYVDELTKEAEEREKKDTKEIDIYQSCLMFDNSDTESEEEYQTPKYIFIFDDLSNEIKTNSYDTLLKKARHFEILTITSSQNLKDLSPSSRNQIRIWILFQNLNDERLKTIYDAISSVIPYEQFKKMYKYATKEKYNFFYIAPRCSDFRINFNKQFVIK